MGMLVRNALIQFVFLLVAQQATHPHKCYIEAQQGTMATAYVSAVRTVHGHASAVVPRPRGASGVV